MGKTSEYINERSKEDPKFQELVDAYKEILVKDSIILEQQEKIRSLEEEINIWKYYH